MVWGGEFGSSSQQRFSQEDLVIGCLVDLATGLMNFTANGKEINTFYQVSEDHLFKRGTVVALKKSLLGVHFLHLNSYLYICSVRWSPTLSCSQLCLYCRPTRTCCSWNSENSRSALSSASGTKSHQFSFRNTFTKHL